MFQVGDKVRFKREQLNERVVKNWLEKATLGDDALFTVLYPGPKHSLTGLQEMKSGKRVDFYTHRLELFRPTKKVDLNDFL